MVACFSSFANATVFILVSCDTEQVLLLVNVRIATGGTTRRSNITKQGKLACMLACMLENIVIEC